MLLGISKELSRASGMNLSRRKQNIWLIYIKCPTTSLLLKKRLDPKNHESRYWYLAKIRKTRIDFEIGKRIIHNHISSTNVVPQPELQAEHGNNQNFVQGINQTVFPTLLSWQFHHFYSPSRAGTSFEKILFLMILYLTLWKKCWITSNDL